jgi:hypothetical protein
MPLPASDHPARAKGRQEIADLQRALVAALTAEAGAPQGFNHTEVARTAMRLSNGSIAIALRLRRGIRRIVIPVPFVARPGLRIRERAR